MPTAKVGGLGFDSGGCPDIFSQFVSVLIYHQLLYHQFSVVTKKSCYIDLHSSV